MAPKAIVASSHQLASFSGLQILKKGGNVIDAAIATSATLCVTQNNLCGLGGDLFALFRIHDSTVKGINGSGRAGRAASIPFYEERGLHEIPTRGPLSAITVPGIVDSWGKLAKFCNLELKELLAPAIGYAEGGVPLTPNYAQSIVGSSRLLSEYKEWSRTFLPSGAAPVPGSLFVQRDLASTLRTIAEEGPDTFYKGTLSERITEGVQSQGGLLRQEDFRTHESTWTEPLKSEYEGVEVYEPPPNSQGGTVLLWLNLLEESNIQWRGSAIQPLPTFVKTYLLANEERRKRVTVPTYLDLPAGFTSKEYAHRLGVPSRLPSHRSVGGDDPGDTTYFAVADSEGNCASVIQSNYMGFGSGIVPEGTGLVLQNRGTYFSLNPRHHNCLTPGKRTFHTLCASIGVREGQPLFCIGDMGGDVQPQVNVQLITNIMDLRLNIQEAIDRPRWAIPGSIYETPSTIEVEEDLFPEIGAEIAGLKTSKIPALSSATGHAQGIVYLESGLSGGADPRGDGTALGF